VRACLKGEILKAIKVKLKRRPITEYISSYTCPSCGVTIEGTGLPKEVTRFKCFNCERELIIETVKDSIK